MLMLIAAASAGRGYARLCTRSIWLTPIKLSPFVSVVGEGEGVRPWKLTGGNAEILCALTQIIVMEVVISVFAARVIPHAHLGLLPVQLQFVQLSPVDRFGLSAAKEHQGQGEDELTHNAKSERWRPPNALDYVNGVRPPPSAELGWAEVSS